MYMIKNGRIDHELLVALSQIDCIWLDYVFMGKMKGKFDSLFNLR